ncbi:unnamed protein product [Parnassius apollo]|uniref:(apollo) hypothetical protein n=1 Tax=Parnassius apollo TaxID=110799 RepID=A0A8S3Y5J1_PARAO|nr:unnamed protein product [Parnassius apollo]
MCLVVWLKICLEPKTGICRCKTRLDGKVALVTGGNSGIGLETARDLAKRGARVIIASRNAAKSEQAVTDIIATTGNKNVEYRCLNLCKFSSVRDFADDFNKTVDRLDILVNNAGCADLEPSLTVTEQNLTDRVRYILRSDIFGNAELKRLRREAVPSSDENAMAENAAPVIAQQPAYMDAVVDIPVVVDSDDDGTVSHELEKMRSILEEAMSETRRLSALGSLAGGAAGIAKAVNDSKAAQKSLQESERRNRMMEAVALGKGLYIKPHKQGAGLYLNPSKN